MTISVNKRLKKHVGNGAAKSFPYDFYIPDADSLDVYVYDTVTQIRTLVDPSDYDVTGLGSESFGNVTYPLVGSAIDSDTWIIIVRAVDYSQDMAIPNQSAFLPEVLENQLDLIVMQVQQVAEQLDRVPKLVEGDTFTQLLQEKSLLANKFLGFDGSGEPQAQSVTSAGELTDPVPIANGGTGVATKALVEQTFGASPVGSVLDYVGSSAPTNWLLLSGGTIGNASSGASARANADTETLFTLLWNSMANGQAAVSGGRGASAAADFAADKTIALPDARGRVIAGQDDMGGSSANRLTDADDGLNGDTLGDTGGGETQTLVAANHAAHTHGAGSLSAADHTHLQVVSEASYGSAIALTNANQLRQKGTSITENETYDLTGSASAVDIGKSGASGALTVSGTSGSQGSGTAFGIVQPTLILNKIIRYK